MSLTVADALELIRMEYLEMPGLKLTVQQARRLWNLPADRCEAVLAALIEQGFLARTVDGSYVRRGGSPEWRTRDPYVVALPDAG